MKTSESVSLIDTKINLDFHFNLKF